MMITAHSGCDGTSANSREYILHAASLPIDALEFDVRKAQDGKLMLTHDPIGDAPLVSLEEGLALVAGKDIKVNFDLKEYGLEEDVLACAGAHGMDKSRIILTGSVTDCMHFREKHPDVTVFINGEELVPHFYQKVRDESTRREAVEQLLARCREAGYATLNLNYRVCAPEFLSACRQAGLTLSVWTVDDVEEMKRLKAAGVLGLTTNNTKAAVEEKIGS